MNRLKRKRQFRVIQGGKREPVNLMWLAWAPWLAWFEMVRGK